MENSIYIAGATGAVGKQVIKDLKGMGTGFIPHLRPRPGRKGPFGENAALYELSDHEKLRASLSKCKVAVQLIGTIKKRFSTGDTYKSSDIDTTEYLVRAAEKAGSIKHFVLLSSVGAGAPLGAYLKAKQEAESLVINSSLSYSIIRPSAFMGDRHKLPYGSEGLFKLTKSMGLKKFSDKYKPIKIEELSKLIIKLCSQEKGEDRIYEGTDLWELVQK